MKLKKSTSTIYFGFLIILCFCIYMFGIHKIYGFIIFPDEFGYWSPAAKALGYDWSEVTSLGSYYSFGYSVILVPILALVSDATTAYRVAIGINACLMCIALYLLCQIFKKIFPYLQDTVIVLIGGIAIFYPAWIFYMQMTMSEALLMFMFVLICYLMICMIENPKAITAAGLATALVYIYFVHMRSLGIVLAAVISLIIYAYFNPVCRKKVVLLCFMLGIAGILGNIAKKAIADSLYYAVETDFFQVNDYGGQWKKIEALFTLQGALDFLYGCMGKILYMGISTFGLFFWGSWYAIKKTAGGIVALKRRRKLETEAIFGFFILSAGVLQILISVIYTLGTGRIDLLIHGRYNELIVPVFIALGIVQLLEADRRKLMIGLMIILQGIFVLVLSFVIQERGMVNVHGYFMAGMSYMLDENNFEPVIFLWKSWFLGIALTVFISLVVKFICNKTRIEWFLTVILALHIGLGMQISGHYTYRGNEYGYGDIQLAEKIQDLSINKEDSIVHLYENNMQYIEIVQFRLRDKKIKIIKDDDAGEYLKSVKDKFVIVDAESKYKEKLNSMYEGIWESGHLILYYNP